MDTFYGIKLDPDDPYLLQNLGRLEARFRQRYTPYPYKRMKNGEKEGKASHKSTLQSIQDNKDRIETVRKIREQLL